MRRHIKRLVFPKTWNIKRKTATFVIRPKPSGHKFEYSMPIHLIIKNMTEIASKRKETQKIVNKRSVFIDGKKIKTLKRPAGLMDVISFENLDEKYVLTLGEDGRLKLIESKHPNRKIIKIVKKQMSKGGKFQYVTHDGRSFYLDTKDYKVGDSLIIEIPTQKILKHINMDKDSIGLFLAGKNVGKTVKVKNIIQTKTKEPDYIEFESDGDTQRGRKSQFFVLGNNNSELE